MPQRLLGPLPNVQCPHLEFLVHQAGPQVRNGLVDLQQRQGQRIDYNLSETATHVCCSIVFHELQWFCVGATA
jgi:hypothetical protein